MSFQRFCDWVMALVGVFVFFWLIHFLDSPLAQ